MSQSLKQKMQELLAHADIKINGNRPWDIQINDERFYNHVFTKGSLGLGETYIDKWWEVKSLDQFFYKIQKANLRKKIKPTPNLIFHVLKARLFNKQKKSKAFEVGDKHYDKGNDLYQAMLDKRMTYTSGYWKNTTTLDEAQEAKLDLVCKKIGLKKGDHVLDIGGGWGSFAKFAAERYGAKVTAITVSKEQVELGKKLSNGLPIEIRLQDYRNINEKFDHIVSLGMFEHVGRKNYRAFMEIAHRSLKDNGLFLLQTIGNIRSVHAIDPWVEKYIFPNAMLPSISQIGKSIENLFVMEDWHNFGADYDKTLMAWFSNFDKNWDKLSQHYDKRFYRIWKYYLLLFAGLFRSGRAHLWQIVLSKNGVSGGYKSIR